MARKDPKRIGLAIVGAGRVGLFRGEVAARHPMVDFIGVADLRQERISLVKERTKADFATTDFRELLKRPEVTAAIIATDEHLHVDPIRAAIERAGADAVVGYTQRFRRRFLGAKEKIRSCGRAPSTASKSAWWE
ncbi:MAG: Gfo/Idh/MocA family oxidoreductase, partial [Burkholderiales bacterium]